MNETARPLASIAPIQTVSPLSGGSGHGAARRMSICAASRVEHRPPRAARRNRASRMRNRRRPRRGSPARACRFDQRVGVGEALDAGRRRAARRGRAASARRAPASAPACCRASPSSTAATAARANRRDSGLRSARVIGGADALQIGGDLAPDVAAIEIVEPGVRELRERVGEARHAARSRPLRPACRRREKSRRSRARRSARRRRSDRSAPRTRETGIAFAGVPFGALRAGVFSGSRPPSALATVPAPAPSRRSPRGRSAPPSARASE